MRTAFNLNDHPHKRYNPLTAEWVLVSPHRTKRPWQGKTEAPALLERPSYDASCYLCPGNTRADGSTNPQYTGPYAFTNDYSALLNDTPPGSYNENNLLVAESQGGICRVLCFSPRHDLTLPELSLEEIEKVVALWISEFNTLAAKKDIRYIQIFENKGEIMGCSNPHPHGQIWSLNDIPAEPAKETLQQEKYFGSHGRSLLADYVQLELAKAERIVCSNKHFVALVPFWAVWPFETMIVSKRHVQHMNAFNEEEQKALADILKRLTTRYDNLFKTSFPYSAGIHQAPVNDGPHPGWHWHMHFYPPLLRSATVKKFMVGYEMLASPQRDITPEWAAAQLRNQAEVHFKTV
ncbi:UDP-glucose--hexose-1-phosphate uridylyltransferase [Deminuibacter soli]|uniref:Galactose-1-phosphate uridylyltransferase n=1 Tax=Deminuibacter soli TaxID=2291815 RepID=A0A3E1NLR3_9BACT|nr:UDP-glucose--hexose-1-phosphate uridylyltransferase [Deminuibacter soli]RFM28842.1 UDP-glucose--hexose-1-phosphate uridylyltransferase [Deminuibacter soli]